MDYKSLYIELANTLDHLRVAVADWDHLGFCCHTKGLRAFIYIKATLSYKQKFFVLIHEVGHLFYMRHGEAFVWSKKIRSEDQANQYAMKALKLMGIKSNEYWKFYNASLKKTTARRKSWMELK